MGDLIRTPFSEVSATLEVLGRLGVTSEHLHRIRSDENLAKKVAEILTSVTVDYAREIMGKNFFGVLDAARYFGVMPAERHFEPFSKIPFSEATLRECKNSHILIAVFPLSILDIRDKTQGQNLFFEINWTENYKEAFARNKSGFCWQLIQKTPQLRPFMENEEVPSVRVIVYTILGYYLATGKHLFEDSYVAGSEGGLADGYSDFGVGYFDSDNSIDISWYGGCYKASARKPDL